MIGWRARLGFLVPPGNPTVEPEMMQLAPPGVSVHFTRTGEDEFTLSVFRGFSESFWEWLTSQAAEFGYQVS